MKPKYEVGDLIVDYWKDGKNEYRLIYKIENARYHMRVLDEDKERSWFTTDYPIRLFDEWNGFGHKQFLETKVFKPEQFKKAKE